MRTRPVQGAPAPVALFDSKPKTAELEIPFAGTPHSRTVSGATASGGLAHRLLGAIRKTAAVGACLGVLLGSVAGTAPASGVGVHLAATNQDDQIEITRHGDLVRVTINGVSRDFTKRQLREVLRILGLDGNDTIRVGPGLEGIELEIDGGGGDDRIYGGDGAEVLAGGDGNDEIHGGGGRD